MKLRSLIAGAFAAALAFASLPAIAAGTQVMCSANVSGGQASPRTIGGTLSPVPSGTIYTLNGHGCAVIALQDIGYFQSQGFVQVGAVQSIVYTAPVLASGTTDTIIATLPANTYIVNIIVSSTAAAAVTGGIAIGTTANGVDIVAALTCGASCLTYVVDVTGANNTILKRVFSLTAQTAIHAAAVTSWNSAVVTFTVLYAYF